MKKKYQKNSEKTVKALKDESGFEIKDEKWDIGEEWDLGEDWGDIDIEWQIPENWDYPEKY
jgi:hypothetical protein